MNYTLHQLQVFLRVVEAKSITKAAVDLFLTQPAVSIQLKNFQDQFDIPLTNVIGKQIYITDFGLEIAEIAERIINEVNAINFKSFTYKGVLVGRLKLAIVSTGKYIMPYFLTDFIKTHSGVELSMDVTNKSKVIKSLENNEVDFALVSIYPIQGEFEEEILLDNKLFLVGNTEVKMKAKSYSQSILTELSLIYREQGSGTRFVMEDFIEKKKLTIRKKFELTSNEAVKQAVIAGLGYSIMPLIGIHNELLTNAVQVIPVAGLPLKSKWRLIWLKNKKLSPVSEAFLRDIRVNKQKIIDKNFAWLNDFDRY